VELPVIGPALYRLNVSRVAVRRMLQAHVYGDLRFASDRLLDRKTAITRRPRARFATAALVTGGLDLITDRPGLLGLFHPMPKAPVLVLIGSSTPPKSRGEMDALAALPLARSELVPLPPTRSIRADRSGHQWSDRLLGVGSRALRLLRASA
jgi:hypothetical protein